MNSYLIHEAFALKIDINTDRLDGKLNEIIKFR